MRLLAIDTSSEACSVALSIGNDVLETHVIKPREHTRILLPMIHEILHEGDVPVAQLDAIVLGNGPGSFIGMRIGASVAQGICYGAGIRIAAVSSLAAVAQEVISAEQEKAVVVAQDARMNEVYVGQYAQDDAGNAVAVCAEQIQQVGPLDLSLQGAQAAGAAWQKYAELSAANQHQLASVGQVIYPRASCMLPAGRDAVARDQLIEPEMLMPAYLRTVVAQVPAGRKA